MNARKIEGSVALVTGANRGIGRAIVATAIAASAKPSVLNPTIQR